ncbi:hypothetical protein G5C51_16700 [Streptomyces sp. A7024]|uniref:ACT domain-containing protein n=1 Tax=Streptomyces coryli TaxID=1128680 RepID=A0A6G4U195_9ACTN|nr:hypothetical protein [Streptomyces coryli]NGN65530.1 hypothetical protein [Streptomyces coryli]
MREATSDEQLHRTLTVTLHHNHGTLCRITAVLNSVGVVALTYATTPGGHATAEILVPGANAARAQAKLRRMVDVTDVT